MKPWIKIAGVFVFQTIMAIMPLDAQPKQRISLNEIVVWFDEATQSITVERHGKPMIKNAITVVHYGDEEKALSSREGSFKWKLKGNTTGKKGGRQIALTHLDATSGLEISWNITLVDSMQGVLFETTLTNKGHSGINITSVEPLLIDDAHKGYLFWKDASKCLTNGPMYYDAGMIQDFDENFKKPEFYGETKGGVMQNTSFSNNEKNIQSWWNIALFSGYDNEALSIGYIENRNSLGRIQVLKQSVDKFVLSVESVYNPGFFLKPGASVSSDPLLVLVDGSPFHVLEKYADIMALRGNARTGSIINGWCNWFYTLDYFSEDEILENALFIAENLKPYGLEYIQIDEGFQTLHSNWEGNSRFPHGLKGFAREVKAMGFKPGIWIAPFVISENSEVFKKHPDWLLKDEHGNLKRIWPWPNENTDWFRNESPKRYALDITNPDAQKWYTDLIDTIANNWGFEMIKVDFVAWTVFSAHHFYDSSSTPAQVYAKAIKIMREVAGEHCHILACGPGNISIGSINSMRVEYDQNYGYREEVWKQYFGGPSCSAGAAGKRYFFHNRTWINDVDHLCMDLLSDNQAKAAATIIALSGGNTMSGDRLPQLTASKMEILKKVFPQQN